MRRIITFVFLFTVFLCGRADDIKVTTVNSQQRFDNDIPAGNYSGIYRISSNRYAVVSDKSSEDGFFVFTINIDTISGRITDVRNEGFVSANIPNRDIEDIVVVDTFNTVFICGEQDSEALEYSMNGQVTGRRLEMPNVFKQAAANYGLESLAYHSQTKTFWTTSESTLTCDGIVANPENKGTNILRLQSFDINLHPLHQYYYKMDKPEASGKADNYAFGVSALCCLDSGEIVVLEREFMVKHSKLGSFVNCKLYIVNPKGCDDGSMLDKTLLTDFSTKLSLFNIHDIANYEGLCLGPKLDNYRQLLILVADSQNQYKGVLKDWFKTIVISH